MAQHIAAKIDNQIVQIPVSEIILNPEDPRSEEPVDMQLLASLKKSGQADPGTVRKVDGNWVIISGNRRLKALQSLQEALKEKGSTEVLYFSARQFFGTPEESRQLVALSNSYRKDFTTKQKAQLIYKYQQEGMDAKEIAAAFGLKNAAEIYDILKVLESAHASSLYELEESGVASPTTIRRLARDADPQEKIEELKKIANQQRLIAARAPKVPTDATAAGDGTTPAPKKPKKVSQSAILGVYKINCFFTVDDLKRIAAKAETPIAVTAFIAHALLQDPEALKLIREWLPEDLQETGKSVNPALKQLAKEAAEAEATQTEEAPIPQSEAVDNDGDDTDEEADAAFETAIS